MKTKPCKECPWIVKNNHNDSIVSFSKRNNKPHNCHMINGGENLWNVEKNTKCKGRKLYEQLQINN